MLLRLLKGSESLTYFLFGPRGVGKTTWLHAQVANPEQVLWVDLLNQRTELHLNEDPEALKALWLGANKPPLVVIDEVQKIPRILDVVHSMIEEHKLRFILTGSSARKLRRGGANLLASRAAEKHLYPLTSFEIGESFDLHRALATGLLPKLYLDKINQQDRVELLYGYISTYLREEVAAEQLVRNLEPFRRFLTAAGQMNAKLINHSRLERDAGIGANQSVRNFEILVDTLLGHFLEPYDTSLRKRQTQRSKFYFFDTGIVRALQNLADEKLVPQSFEFGDLFETFLINEFIKLRSYLNKRWRFSYLRTKEGLEIDLIIEKPRGHPILVEIKSSDQIKEDHLQNLIKLKADLPHSAAYCLSCQKDAIEIQGVRCLPWNKGLAEIFEI